MRSPPLTLWTAAKVRFGKTTTTTTFSGWQKTILPTKKAKNCRPPPVNKLNPKTDDRRGGGEIITRTYKIGLRPTVAQKKALNACILAANFAYNQCVHLVNRGLCRPDALSLQSIVGASGRLPEKRAYRYRPKDDEWFWNFPSPVTKQMAVKDFCAAVEKRPPSKIKFKKHDEPANGAPISGTFGCRKQLASFFVNDDGRSVGLRLSLRAFGGTAGDPILFVTKKKNRNIPKIERDFKITKTPKGKFVLCLPVTDTSVMRRARPPSPERKSYCCGIDPGARSFITVYDPSRQECFQFGTTKEKAKRLIPLVRRIDRWMTKTPERRRRSRRRIEKLWYRVNNSVNSLHNEVIAYLVKSYNRVAIGILNRRRDRWLGLYRHSEFRNKLLARVEGEVNISVEITDENFTSKTCSVCKTLNRTLGAKESFDCSTCGFSCHRDVNGAKNIFLRSQKMF